jgi:hypothetical protein
MGKKRGGNDSFFHMKGGYEYCNIGGVSENLKHPKINIG